MLLDLLLYLPLLTRCGGSPQALEGGLAKPDPWHHPERQESASVEPRQARGKVRWFQGSFEALLAEAQEKQALVLLDFYARDDAYSRKLEKVTYGDARVVSALGPLLCYSVDVEDRASRSLRKRFHVHSAPTLVFLDPDGALRDQLSGFQTPERLVEELARIQRNEGTLSSLRARIRADPDDLDARWELACKLRAFGDLATAEEQESELRERDPKGTSMAGRRMRLAALYSAASARLELEPLYRFVETEKDPGLRFEAWNAIWALEGQALRSARSAEDQRRCELRYFAAARALWPLVPAAERGRLGNNIAWDIYENRARAARPDLEFALEVARKAAEAAPTIPAVVDTLACCLFAVGLRAEALEQVRRCIDLDPENPAWRERWTEFSKAKGTAD